MEFITLFSLGLFSIFHNRICFGLSIKIMLKDVAKTDPVLSKQSHFLPRRRARLHF